MPQIDFIVPYSGSRRPWAELQDARLAEVRRLLNFQVSPSFPLEIRALTDSGIAERANTVIHYLNRWDASEPPVVTIPGADATNARLEAFRAAAPQLVLFVKLASRQTGRNDSRLRMGEHARLHAWCETWLSHRPADIAGGRMLYDHYAERYGEDLGTRGELHAAIATWRAAGPEEHHAAVLLAWLASAREMAALALLTLVAAGAVEDGATVWGAQDTLDETLALLRYCNVPDEPLSEDSDDSGNLFFPPPFGSEER